MYYISGNSSSNMPFTSVTIDGNTLSDAYYCGIYNYYYSRYPSISNNIIKSCEYPLLIALMFKLLYGYRWHENNIYIVSNSGGYSIRYMLIKTNFFLWQGTDVCCK